MVKAGSFKKMQGPGDIDTLERLLQARHSCRAFRPDPVPDEAISRLLETAQRTASWCNVQPWRIVVTKGEGTRRFRDAIVAQAETHGPAPDFPFPIEYRGVNLERRRECGFQLYSAVGIKRGDANKAKAQFLENFRFFGAPHVAIITTDDALGVYGAIDCGCYVANFLLAAQAIGLAAIPQAALATHSNFVRDWFGLADDRRVVCGISFGYEDEAHPANRYRTSRAALSEVVTYVGG
jgi:nitroreductase